jgi:hypothetical protein
MDSTNNLLIAIGDILTEWQECKRKGQIILHSDGNGIKKVEFNYSVEIRANL